MRVLVLGGTRSGKSAFAEGLLDAGAAATYVATAAADPSDTEWSARITTHRHRRPTLWSTVDSSLDLPDVIAKTNPPVLVDDLGGWVVRCLDAQRWESPVLPVDPLTSAIAASGGPLILVSPEVGLAPVAPSRAGRIFADAIGTVNQAVAAVCHQVVLVVAGQPLWIKGAR